MNFRDFCKQSVTNGLESDSGYTSDSDSSAVEIIENSNSPQKPQRSFISSDSDGSSSDIVELKNDIDDETLNNCSPNTAKLLKSGILYNSQIKRIISIWPQLFR